MLDPTEEVQSFLIAAPDRIAAEHRLRSYLGPIGAKVESLGELLDDVSRVWGRDGQSFEGTLVPGTDSDEG